MDTVRKTITCTEQQHNWIKLKIKSGNFKNDSEYIRDLVRKDQAQNEKLLELKMAIDDGLNSGVSNKSISDLIDDVDQANL